MSQELPRRQTLPLRLGPGAGRHPSREHAQRSPSRAHLPAASTLAEIVMHWGQTRPSQPLLSFVDLEDRLTVLTAGELLRDALRLGAHLRARGVGRGDRVVLSFDTSPEFLECFFACGLVGATPCLIELPSSKVSVQTWSERLRVKLRMLGAPRAPMHPDTPAPPGLSPRSRWTRRARPSSSSPRPPRTRPRACRCPIARSWPTARPWASTASGTRMT